MGMKNQKKQIGMNSLNLNELRQAVERLHNCKASHVEDITVIEKFGEKTVWSGVVSVFS